MKIAAERLGNIARHAPEAIVPYSYAGTMGLVQGESIAACLWNVLGASRLDRTICAAAGATGLKYTYGASLGVRHERRVFPGKRNHLDLGANPIASSLHFWTLAQEAKRRGTKLIAIDSYKSLSAEKCHQHIVLRPGTDAALALMIHVLIRENLVDRAYIDAHTLGFDELAERAAQYPPSRVAQVCGISDGEVIDLACAFGSTKKAAIRLNYGMQRTRGGGNAVRAAACLPSLTGAWCERAGGLLLSSSGWAPVGLLITVRSSVPIYCLTGPRRYAHHQYERDHMNATGDALLHPGDEIFARRSKR